MKFIENFRDYLGEMEQGELALFLACGILFFILTTFIFFVMLMTRRINRISFDKAMKDTVSGFENLLLSYLFDEIDLKDLLSKGDIRKALKKRKFRNVLLAEVLKLHGNFSGEYASRLENFYVESGLESESHKKLNSKKWFVKCKGIKELTQMKTLKSTEKISKYTYSRNRVLRSEAQISILKLNGFKGLAFLENFKGQISDWEQLNFVAALKNADVSFAPNLSSWLASPNPSLRLLTLRMGTEFKLTEITPAILANYKTGTEEVKENSIKALEILHQESAIDFIKAAFSEMSPILKSHALKAIGILGDEKQIVFLIPQLDNDNYKIRLEAARAIKFISGDLDILKKYVIRMDEELENIIDHVTNDRISA